MAKTWDQIADNEPITYAELKQAIADGYLTLRSDQSVADTDDKECTSSVQAIGWLFIDPAFMPSIVLGELPVKANYVGLPSSVHVTVAEADFVDVNLFFAIDNTIVDQPASTFDKTYSVRGGALITAVMVAENAPTLDNPQKHLRITENGDIIYDSVTVSPGDSVTWYKRILANANYQIEVYSTGDAISSGYRYRNNTGMTLIYQKFISGTPQPLINIPPGDVVDMLTVLTAPGDTVRVFGPNPGRYTFTPAPGGAVNSILIETYNAIIDDFDYTGVQQNINDYNVRQWTLTYSPS